MRSNLLLGILLAVVLWPAGRTYSRGTGYYPCLEPSEKASACNNLRGSVHTVELWSSFPDDQKRALLTYSEEGILIERKDWKNGVLKSRSRYEKTDKGSTFVEDNLDDQGHSYEDVTSLNERGNVTSRTSRRDGGPFTVNEQFEYEFNSVGQEVPVQVCSMDGKNCVHKESKYDDQGRLTFYRQIELPSARVMSHTEFEYPSTNRKRTLDFTDECRDSSAPSSLPTYITETIYDGAGRVVEETTTAPGFAKAANGLTCLSDPDNSPHPGHMVIRYDAHGHLVDESNETDGARGTTHARSSYRYDKLGNEISEHTIKTEPSCGRAECRETDTTDTRHEFVFEYDQFGNWTSKRSTH
jgi:hypothetical protein